MTHKTVIQRLRRARDIRQSNLIGEPGLVDALAKEIDISSISHLINNGYIGELRRQRPDLVDEALGLISYISKERK